MISAPGVTMQGSSTRQLAESVDVYPTLAELAGLPVPDVPQGLDGISLVPVLRNPEQRLRDHAYHVYPKAKLGRAIRTERYRLVEWKRVGDPETTAEYELYDYEVDPEETRNLAGSQPEIVSQLQQRLRVYPQPRRP
jgi:iduronate 2-sulfatase